MSKFECEKAKNCFSNAETYEYRLPIPVTDEILKLLEGWGDLTVKRNIRRPFYRISMEEAVEIKGILEDNIIKISYPTDGWEVKKERVERLLEELLAEPS